MKIFSAATVSLALAVAVFVGVNWHRNPIQVVAQESPSVPNSEQRGTAKELAPAQSDLTDEHPSTAFFINDVVQSLTTATADLIKEKLTRNSGDLRKELDRTSFPIRFPKASSTELSTQELYRKTAESVFLVASLTQPYGDVTAWQTAFSTAFAVHEDGILSTSAHVFDHDDHDDAVVVMDIHGKVFPVVEILASDRKNDTCLFRIRTKGIRPLPLGPTVYPGTPVRVIGHPGDSFFYFSAGHVANYERDDDGILWLNVTADFGQGSSGGPVMDSAGNIVGQVSRTYTLYAGGEARGRTIRVRQVADGAATEAGKEEPPEDENEVAKRRADPQMVFKSCTPVSAIRALGK